MDSCPAAPFSLGAVRKCQHGEWITYSATLETRGAEAVHALLDRLENAGLCTPHLRFGSPDVYAVLGTIYTDEGMFSGDQAIPTKVEFDRLNEALSLRIRSSDCEQGCK
ncbi:uncharacterized protein RMCN_0861 [Mycolicibacterium novocastrense]|nr:uncharacterized protein RMCN_0861 [Mycolicibacterium novocastrense]